MRKAFNLYLAGHIIFVHLKVKLAWIPPPFPISPTELNLIFTTPPELNLTFTTLTPLSEKMLGRYRNYKFQINTQIHNIYSTRSYVLLKAISKR